MFLNPPVPEHASDTVEIVYDRWGVAHVRAADAAGAFFGQGYAAAAGRLFQMELWRRRGLGTLAEVLGPDYVDYDIAARTFLARTTPAEEYAALPEGAEPAVEAFVAGINLRIREVREGQAPLPVEFTVLGFHPTPWTAAELLSIRVHGLHANVEEEVARAATLHAWGAEAEELRRLREPAVEPQVPDGLDLSALSPDILKLYRRAHEPVPFRAGTGTVPLAAHPDGSNNWAVAGERTATGRPIVATDPHRMMTFPALRTLVHLSCPEFDVIGMNEPYMPGVASGHNSAVAYSFTIAPMDVEDLYVYELHPDDPTRYRYGAAWETMTEVTEQIPVARAGTREHTVRFTRHGPVIHTDPARKLAYGLRAVWLEPGTTPYLGSLGLLRARTVDELTNALDGCASPGLNYVYADLAGDIGWQVAGRAPVRSGWDGLLPVPGDGRYEWDGARTAAQLPGLRNPDTGWVRSANHCNLSEDPDWAGTPYSYEWYSGYRAQRIAEALNARTDWDVPATGELQNDYLSLSARGVLALLAEDLDTAFEDPDAEFARRELRAWNLRMTHGSRAAAIFDRWLYRHLGTAVRALAASRLAPGRGTDLAAVLSDTSRATIGDPRTDIELLARPELWGGPAFPHRRSLLERTLAAAVGQLRTQADGSTEFTWGDSQTIHLRHPLHAQPGFPAELGDTGAHPKSGSSDTVGLAFGSDGVQTLGAATRVVMDLADWDNSVFVTMPGVDGDVESPHSQDLFDTWLADAYVPLVYTPARVDAEAQRVIHVQRIPSAQNGDTPS